MNATPTLDRHTGLRVLLALLVGLPTLIAVVLLAFAAPAIKSGPKALPLAVSGPASVVTQLTAALGEKRPGAFTITPYGTADEAATAIRNREAIGGLAAAPTGLTIQTAAGAGAPYATLLKGLGAQLAAGGQQVSYAELAPLTNEDPAGSGLTALGLPLILGGMATAVALTLAHRGSAARIGTALALSVLAGLLTTAILQFGFRSFDGNYLLISAAVAAGLAAISLSVLGLGLLWGAPGLGLGVALMLFVANPISGLGAGPAWLPQPWGDIGQYLPVGAAGTAMRSAAYFDGAGATRAWIVLAVWALAGALVALAARGERRNRTPALTPHVEHRTPQVTH